MAKTSQKLLTLQQCEEMTGRKISTWRKAIAQRTIPFVRLGRSIRVPLEYIQALIDEGWREPVKNENSEKV